MTDRPNSYAPNPGTVLLAGVSTRAAAESAARAGFAVTAVDAFGDLDQYAAVRSLSLPRDFGVRFTAAAAARICRNLGGNTVTYLSGFENHPRAVGTLATGRVLWGNRLEVLRRVRDPLVLADALRRRGCAVPELYVIPESRVSPESYVVSGFSRTGGRQWLVKPLASGGGHRVRLWRRGARIPRRCYLQELVVGTPGSVVFVAAAGRSRPIGVSRQLVGERTFGASGYQYCGSLLTAATGVDDAALVDQAAALTAVVAEEFGLVGVNGVDFIAHGRIPYAIEVNPRWSASMELVERAYGLSVFGVHAAACADGVLPAFDLGRARREARTVGKAVVFARRDVTVGDTRRWLEDPSVRDIPNPGERIAAGRPVCTVFAEGRDAAGCHSALVDRADRVYEKLAAWEQSVA